MAFDEGTWEGLVQNATEYIYGKQYEKAIAAIIDIDLYIRQHVLVPTKPGAQVIPPRRYGRKA